MWVEVVACRLIGHYFSAMKTNELEKLIELKDKYILFGSNAMTFNVSKQLCRQLGSKLVTGMNKKKKQTNMNE